MKKVIGIVPAAILFDQGKSNMTDRYIVGNNYAKRVTEAGCIPVSIAPADGWAAEEALNLCDGFIVQGGEDIYPYHFQVMHHAFTCGKRYLGICLGEQVIYYYFYLRKIIEEKGEAGELLEQMWELYERIEKKEDPSAPPKALKRIEGHSHAAPARGKEDEIKHDVAIVPGTVLHRLMGRETLRGASVHTLQIPAEQDLLTINAWAADSSSVVEGVEYGENILGIQCHPEVDGMLPEIFSFLAEG